MGISTRSTRRSRVRNSTKALFFSTLAIALFAFITGCCCGGGSSSDDFDWSEFDTSTTSEPGTFAKSCDDGKSLSQCSEYTDKSMELLGEDFYKSICELTSGKWSADKCPTEGVAGKCDDGAGSMTYYYSSGDLAYTKETAKKSCEDLMGTFKE